MIRPIGCQPKWLARLVIPAVGSLLIGGCAPANQPPVISSLTAHEQQVSCVASDPDGDELSYTWSASGGDILGEGATVTWVAPDEAGTYTITVKVTDVRGGEATTQLITNVVVNDPPIIDGLITKWRVVRRATPCVIECVASDPDGDKLSYTWSASGGNIRGEGATITWVAPNTYGTHTIRVTVTDGWGNEATESISIVVSCECP